LHNALEAPSESKDRHAALQYVQDCLNIFSNVSNDGDSDTLSSMWQDLLQAVRGMEAEHMRATLAGPTPLIPVNAYIGAVHAALAGNAQPHHVAKAAKELLSDLAKLRDLIDAASVEGSIEDGAREIIEDGLVSLQQLETVTRQLADPILLANTNACSVLLQQVVEWAGRLSDFESRLQQKASTASCTPCIQCGHYSPSNRRVCEKCGAVLPCAPGGDEQIRD
jgi:hypothetical protein